MPDRFRSQVAFLNSFPDHVLVGAWVETVNAAGLPIGILRCPTSHEEIDQDHLSGHTSIRHPTAMVRRSAVMSAGCYRSEFIYAEDLDLFLRLAELGKLANLPEIMLQYRLHAGSVSEAKGQVQQAATQSACESAWRRRGIERRFEAVDHWRPGSDKTRVTSLLCNMAGLPGITGTLRLGEPMRGRLCVCGLSHFRLGDYSFSDF